MASKTADNSVLRQIADLSNLSHEGLCSLWRTLHGEDPTASNRPYLIKRLAYRIQEIAYGGLSINARDTMEKVLNSQGFDENGGNMDVRRAEKKRKIGVPVTGTKLVRQWNGRRYETTVVYGGFQYEGRLYKSLTAVATAITGTHWNGRAFFGLKKSHEKRSRGGI